MSFRCTCDFRMRPGVTKHSAACLRAHVNNQVVTYVVDHSGQNFPLVGLQVPVNGGKVVTVALGDLAERLADAESILKEVRLDPNGFEQHCYSIDDYFGGES